MNLFEVDVVKAISRYQRFKSVASIARTIEFFFAAILLSRSISFSSAYFPATVQSSGFFFRRLCMLLVSHRFVFLLGNLIVITLFVKSSNSSSHGGNQDDDEPYLIGQFVPPSDSEVLLSSDVAVSDEKHIIHTEIEVPLDSGGDDSVVRNRRTRSEEYVPEVPEEIQLRRSETESGLKTDRSGEQQTGKRVKVEDLSNEEFQRKVEAFIERQQRFLRDESLSILKGHV